MVGGELPLGCSIRDLDRLLAAAAKLAGGAGGFLTWWHDRSGSISFRMHRSKAESLAFGRDWADDAGPRPDRLFRVNLADLPPEGAVRHHSVKRET